MARTQWVAAAPVHAVAGTAKPAQRRRRRYTGPPRYTKTPRWGFPAVPWRPRPQGEDTAKPAADPTLAAAVLARTLVPLLWTVAVLATVSAGAEIWRYILLLLSREDALSATAVAASDALTVGAGAVTLIAAAGAGLLLVLWSLRAQAGAAERSGVRPARSRREVLLGWLLPGLNLSVPGSVLAEIEHGLLERPVAARPKPSGLVVLWWVMWDVGVVLCVVTLLWALRDGVQALADGVLVHALLDLVAAVTAVVTAVVVRQFTRLLHPAQPPRRMLLVRMGAEPSPTAPANPA
ncbi:MAG: DUF4328 domain-containing protein [Pseudonocardiales bacterium]|nr:DUF4328 domain-containing protein [Pseudonocardiales bacterium]